MSADVEALIGRSLGPTAWREITQELIDTHATVSGDRQWIHVDVDRAARESPYGCTIAHGTLTLALIDGFRDELGGLDEPWLALGVNMGYDRVRFPGAVPVGSRLRASMQITSAAPQGDRGFWRVVQRVSVEREGDPQPACVADCVLALLPRQAEVDGARRVDDRR